MGKVAFLEAFDVLPEPELPAEPAGPSEEWLDGHAAGFAAAMAEFEARQGALSADLCQSVADLNMTVVEARRLLADGLGPLFDGLATQLLPVALCESFAPRVAADLAGMALADLARPLTLRVRPEAVASVAQAVTGLPALAVEIVPDPGLGPLEALIDGPSGESAFDLDRLLSALRAALANLIPEETSAHG